MISLSESQKKAIEHIAGPAIVIAGPGSGKTLTIVNRIINLINSGVDSSSIAVLTFSKTAALNMNERLVKAIGPTNAFLGTFHSLAYGILRTSFGLKDVCVLSESEKRKMLGQIVTNHGLDETYDSELIIKILNTISKQKNSNEYKKISVNAYSESISAEQLDEIITEYEEFIQETGKIDFDDMIIKCLDKLSLNNEILQKYRNRYEYILIDEFQDINPPQYELIMQIKNSNNNIFVVGDDDQAIYGFRGSAPNVMQKFIDDFPGAKCIYLTDNYRSCENIISLATRVIDDNKVRMHKDFGSKKTGGTVCIKCLESRKEEEEYIYKMLRNISKEEADSTAIILRTNREVALYTSYLKSRGIQIREIRKTVSIFNSKEMEDIKAFLRFVYEGEKRRDLMVFLNKPNIYLQRAAFSSETVNKDDVLKYYRNNLAMQNTLNNYFEKINLAKQMPTSLAIRLFFKSMGYEKYVLEKEKNLSNINVLRDNLKTISGIFDKYKGDIGVDAYVENMRSEYEGNKQERSISPGVKVMTMHASKGLEFENVILPDINEGVIPAKNMSEEELEEERRLFYVAVTRAISNLTIISTKERNRDVSRFLKSNDQTLYSNISSNSALSKNSSKASATASYSSSSSM